MNNIDYIQSLLDELNGLPHRNEKKLKEFKSRGRIIIRRIFGDSSYYFRKFNTIRFVPELLIMARDEVYNEWWAEGTKETLDLFEEMLQDLKTENLPNVGEEEAKQEFSNNIFIVHGHDNEMKQTVARTLEKLDLEPIILHEQANEGRTIIEKFMDYSDVSFAVVLLSPDDLAYPKEQSYEDAKFRARQNVILELGFFYR